MSLLDRTPAGGRLDDNGVTVGGWTNLSYTASTARGSQLPYGFNYLANDFLLQQNWLRVDRPVAPDAGRPRLEVDVVQHAHRQVVAAQVGAVARPHA